MKILIELFLAVIISVCFCGCGQKFKDDDIDKIRKAMKKIEYEQEIYSEAIDKAIEFNLG